MKNRKLISLIAFVLGLMMLLSACSDTTGKTPTQKPTSSNSSNTDNNDKTESENESDANEDKDDVPGIPEATPNVDVNSSVGKLLLLADDGYSFKYDIVRAENSSDKVYDAVKNLRSKINKLDCEATVVKDTNKEKTYELLIGQTNREESAKALKKLEDNRRNNLGDFIVQVIGDKKIVINATDEKALIKAVNWFTETFCRSEKTWGYLRENYEFLYEKATTSLTHQVNGTDLLEYVVVTPKQIEFVAGRGVDSYIEYMASSHLAGIDRLDDRDKEQKFEILIGDVDRSSAKSVVTPEKGKYVIKLVGDDIVIKGGDAVSLYYGVEYFYSLVKTADKDKKTLNLAAGYSIENQIPTGKNAFQLTYADEFDGDSLDSKIWGQYETQTTAKSDLGGKVYDKQAENVYVKDGYMILPVERQGKDFYLSRISSRDRMSYKYGCIEIRAKLAKEPFSTALWLNGDGKAIKGPTMEIDILENFGFSNKFASNVHRWWSQNGWDGSVTTYPHTSLDGGEFADAKRFSYDTKKNKDNLSDDFHIYSCNWDENTISFAVDGKVYFTYNYADVVESGLDVFRSEQILVFSANAGEVGYGVKFDEEKDITKSELLIDYVRIYQIPEKSTLNYY